MGLIESFMGSTGYHGINRIFFAKHKIPRVLFNILWKAEGTTGFILYFIGARDTTGFKEYFMGSTEYLGFYRIFYGKHRIQRVLYNF